MYIRRSFQDVFQYFLAEPFKNVGIWTSFERFCWSTWDIVVKLLKDEEKISSDACLIFDEMYLQKSEKYTGGQIIGAATNGKLYKGIASFMNVGIKQNSPYIINSVP